jgi:hypothetical protein
MDIAVHGHWLLSQAVLKWFERLPAHNEILGVCAKIRGFIDQINKQSAETEWAELYFHLQVDRAYCMVGLRFRQLGQFRYTITNEGNDKYNL